MAKRKVPAPRDDEPGAIPQRLRRFRPEEWADPEDQLIPDWADRAVRRRRRFEDAREEWAVAHGFDVRAPYVEAVRGHDWWAFLAKCENATTENGEIAE